MAEVFPYLVDKRFAPLWILFGLRPSRDAVTISDNNEFLATYGFFKLSTSLDNVDGAHITRGYRWWTAVGVRLSGVDDGLTFGTNRDAGVCVHFRDKVPSRLRRRGYSALTVTVANLEGLVSALTETSSS